METAHYKLFLKDLVATLQAVESSQKTLDKLDGVVPVVHDSFYIVSADYHKVRWAGDYYFAFKSGGQAKAEYVPYYKNALLFLSCVDVKDMSAAERLERSYDLSIAALLGETIYNFGELVSSC